MKFVARRRRLSQQTGSQSGRTKLRVEQLEARRLLYAADLLATDCFDSEQILVGDLSGGVQTVAVPAGLSVAQTLAKYASDPLVAFAEPDYVVQAAVIPNDTSFGVLYALHNTGQTIGGSVGLADADIDAPEAWDVNTGITQVAVGVIDTGIDYRHVDLYRNIWINQEEIPSAIRANLTDTDADGLITFWDLNQSINQGAGKISDLDGNGRIDGSDLLNNASGWEDGFDQDPYIVAGNTVSRIDDLVGWNFVNNTNNPLDDNGHGTHVAGTIGAVGNNGVGVAGVLWKTQLAALKFLTSSGSGAISNATAALNYAIANGMEVTNNSWGGGGFSQSFANALTAANAAQQIFVAAAGNNGANNDSTPSYPANYSAPNVVSVAATNNRDLLASFSNYGLATVDLGAPGVSIRSTWPGGGYTSLSGTSMATPHVAGAAALVMSQHDDWTAAEVIASILTTADPVASLTGRVVTGGRLNVNDAVRLDLGDPPPPPQDTTGPRITAAVPSGTSSVSSVRLTFSEAIDPLSFDAFDVTSLIGPSGSIEVSSVVPVASSAGTQFDVTFAAQTTPGAYTIVVGPDISDAAGNAMDQNADGLNGQPDDAFTGTFTITATQTFTNSTRTFIRDYPYTTSSTITIGQDLSIADLNVRLNITHTYDSDLYIYLRAPDGTTVLLVNRRGGSGDNFTNTTLDSEAAQSIATGAAPFAGTYRPEASLASQYGKNARGTWTLVIQDRAYADVGYLNNWSLIVTAGAGSTASADATVWALTSAPPAEALLALSLPIGHGGQGSAFPSRDVDELHGRWTSLATLFVPSDAGYFAPRSAALSQGIRAIESLTDSDAVLAEDAVFAEIGESFSADLRAARLAALELALSSVIASQRWERGA